MKQNQTTYKSILLLAGPIIMSHMGHMTANIADFIMAGDLGDVPLGAVGLSVSIYALFAMFGMGLMSGITPLVAKADAQGDTLQKEKLYKLGLYMAVVAGIILTSLMWSVIPFLDSFGQSPEIIKEAIPYYSTMAATIIFSLLFFLFKQFGEGIHLVKMTMWINLWGNALNIFLNFVFLKGWFGMPELGSLGIGLATLIARVVMLIALVLQMRQTKMKKYIDAFSRVKFKMKALVELLRDCVPIAFQYIIEMSAFTMGAIMAGWFGITSIDAHEVAISIVSVTYLVAAGLGSATSVIIGNAYGNHNLELIRDTAKKSSIITIIIMASLAVILIGFRHVLPSIYTHTHNVINLASSLLIIAAFFQLFDGLQVVGLGILRGINDLNMPTYLSLISYWVITIPLCYFLSTTMGYEAQGIWYGFLIGLGASSILIYLRIKDRFSKMKS